MKGCLRNILAGVGCLTLVILAGAAGYHYRAQLKGFVDSVRPGRAAVADTLGTTGFASETALERARRKERRMASRSGPATVVLTAEELAALIRDGLDPVARRALDSMRVILTRDRLTIDAQLLTAGLERGLLGPIGDIVDAREPLRIAGPAAVTAPGVVEWTPDEIVLRAFPFPGGLIPRLVNAIMGVRDGVVPLAVPPTVGDLRIREDGVTFYRRTD
ncbi:MAG TPA: hypothetical protein VGA02_04025 [Gemmatimonadales bacterium]